MKTPATSYMDQMKGLDIRSIMQKKILVLLLNIIVAISLTTVLYQCGRVVDSHSNKMAEPGERIPLNNDGSDEIWIDFTTMEESLQKTQNQEENVELESVSKLHWMAFCEFEEIEKKHEILEYDISTSPQYDYENTLLREYVDNEKKEAEIFVNTFGSRYEPWIDYHLFDFNDDGLEDYLLCIDGILYSGSAGHSVQIFIAKEDGSTENVLSINLRFCHYKSSVHERFTVLNEKTDGYYAIVLPGTNRILRYDKKEGRYIFHEGE